MAGLDIPSKLRRALGGAKNISPEQISAKLAAFDQDNDGALTREELAKAFFAFGCGGTWFCNIMARNVWTFCEMVVPPPVLWIKISLLGPAIHGFMQLQPRKAKRVAITPAGAYGWEPLMYTDGTPVEPNGGTVLPELPSIYGDPPAALGNMSHRQTTSAHAGEPLTRGPAMPPSPQQSPPSSPAGPRTAPSAAPRGPQAPAGRPPTSVPGRPAPSAAPARPTPAPAAAPRRPGPRR